MKKTTKKLVLAKETVRSLVTADLEQARGGDFNPTYSIQGGCVPTQKCTSNPANETQ